MPWNAGDPLPDSTKSLSAKQKEVFRSVANSMLEDGKSESEAIAGAMSQAKKIEKSFVESLGELIEKHFGGSSKENEPEVEVTKSVDNEQRMAMFVVLEPDVVDLHGDTYSAEEVEKACLSFNQHSMKANLFHKVETENAKIVQSFISPSTFMTEAGKEIKKGTWLQWWHFPEDNEASDEIWKMVKDGDINGVSIGAKGKVEVLDD